MSARRRPASRSPSPSPAADSVSPSPRSPRRQSRELRISAGASNSSGRSSGVKLSASRTRRPTPVVKRSTATKSGRLSDVMPHDHHHPRHHEHHEHRHDESASDEDEEHHDHHHHHHEDDGQRKGMSRRQVSINTESRPNGRGGRNRQVTLASNSGGSRTALDGSPLTWYERLMPECVLNMTAPITGYECELARHGELDDYEYEILERERKRRNGRIRRRLALVMLAAGLASAFFIYRGRLPGRRPPGVRGAITAMTSRLEDGLSKTIHDTMGK